MVVVISLACIAILPAALGGSAFIGVTIDLLYICIPLCCWIVSSLYTHWMRLEIANFMVEIVGNFFQHNMRLFFVSAFYVVIHLIAFFATIMAGVLLSKEKNGSGIGFVIYCIFAWPIYFVFSMYIHNNVCYTTSVAGVFYYYDNH